MKDKLSNKTLDRIRQDNIRKKQMGLVANIFDLMAEFYRLESEKPPTTNFARGGMVHNGDEHIIRIDDDTLRDIIKKSL